MISASLDVVGHGLTDYGQLEHVYLYILLFFLSSVMATQDICWWCCNGHLAYSCVCYYLFLGSLLPLLATLLCLTCVGLCCCGLVKQWPGHWVPGVLSLLQGTLVATTPRLSLLDCNLPKPYPDPQLYFSLQFLLLVCFGTWSPSAACPLRA